MRPTFDLCQTKLKIELESCRRRFRTYSGAFRIGGQKKVVFFFTDQYGPLYSTMPANREGVRIQLVGWVSY